MNYLKVQNGYTWLLSDDLELKRKLDCAFRFRAKNYWHNPAYKAKHWDGFVNYFNKDTGRILTGLLPELVGAIRYLKKEYEIHDERGDFQWLHNEIDKDFLNQNLPEGMNPVELYDFQYDLTNQAIKYKRGIVQAPTGAGKTLILISLMKCIPPKTPVLFLTKDVSLVHQNYEEMQKWGIQDLGRYYGKYREPNYIMCCNTHAKTLESLKSLLPKFKVLIVDESHSCLSKKPIAAYNKMTSARVRIGISATPFKFKGKDLEQKWNAKGYFGPIFQTKTTESGKLTTKNLQDRDILSASQCNFYVIDHPKIWHEPYLDAVTLGIANNFEFHKIVTRLARSLKGRTLVLVERLDQGEYLKQLMPEANWISGSDKIEVKSGVFKELREKETSITIAMRHIITAGINVFLHNLINASGGKAEHSIVQQMGRGLRLANDKEILNYYDFIYHINDYLLEHSTNRISVLKEEGHEVILKEEFDF